MAIGSKLSEQKLQVSLLLWGREGTGKTTDALRLTEVGPGAVVLINAEAGAKMAALRRMGVDVDRVEVWPTEDQGPGHITYETLEAEVIEPLEEALRADPNAYVGVVIDSFTELARRILEKVAADAFEKAVRLGKNRDRFQVDLADHGTASSMMRHLLRRFRDLPCHLVITALERRDVDENTSMVSYGPAMGPAVATDTMGLVDLVGYVSVENIGGTEFRVATFAPQPIRRAKDRYGVLPPKLGDPYVDRVVGYITGEITRDNDPVRAAILAAAAGEAADAAETAKEVVAAETPTTDDKAPEEATKVPEEASDVEATTEDAPDEDTRAAELDEMDKEALLRAGAAVGLTAADFKGKRADTVRRMILEAELAKAS